MEKDNYISHLSISEIDTNYLENYIGKCLEGCVRYGKVI